MKKEEETVLVQKLVNNLINDSRLNSWEREFLESVKEQMTHRGLTEKQMNVLNKLKRKYVTK